MMCVSDRLMGSVSLFSDAGRWTTDCFPVEEIHVYVGGRIRFGGLAQVIGIFCGV